MNANKVLEILHTHLPQPRLSIASIYGNLVLLS